MALKSIFGVRTNSNNAVFASTADGTYDAVTNLPGNANGQLAFVYDSEVDSNAVLIGATAASTAYRTTDEGNSYTTETLPVNLNSNSYLLKSTVSEFFIYSNNLVTDTYYYSSTGETGSWSTGSKPLPGGRITLQPQDIVTCHRRGQTIRITDSVSGTWIDTGIEWIFNDAANLYVLNGIYTAFVGSFIYTYHANGWTFRVCTETLLNNQSAAQVFAKKGTLYAATAANGVVAVFDIEDAVKGTFRGGLSPGL